MFVGYLNKVNKIKSDLFQNYFRVPFMSNIAFRIIL